MQEQNLVNTKKLRGRRIVRYERFDETIADAERLAVVPARTLGNWSVGQIFWHLAKSADVLIDGTPHGAPFPIQWFLRTFMKNRMLENTVPAGFRLPARSSSLVPPEIAIADGLANFRIATARITSKLDRACSHSAFGPCTADDWNRWHLRHCELHMSFILPLADQSRPTLPTATT